jgi:DUF1680 family protein
VEDVENVSQEGFQEVELSGNKKTGNKNRVTKPGNKIGVAMNRIDRIPDSSIDRRQFLRTSALTVAASALPGNILLGEGRGANSQSGSVQSGSVQSGKAPGAKTRLSTFAYKDVTLEPGMHEEQLRQTHAVLMGLDNDALLKPFRVRAGQPAPGPDLGGWYDAYAFCPGHTFGQWLSALSRYYAITGDQATRQKISTLVHTFGKINDPDGRFFEDNRFVGYITEKLNCGFGDAYYFGECPEAATVLAELTKRVARYLPEKALSRAEQAARPHKNVTYTWDETYTLAENYFLASQRISAAPYHDLAVKYLYEEFFNRLAAGDNPLPGMHAYSHLNSLNSAAQAYMALNDATYLKAAVNGFNLVRQQTYATGGWGPDEAFVVPGQGNLGKSLTKTHQSFETPCGAYGEFKLTRSLLSITGDPAYGDAMETVMYNTVLGAKPLLQDGTAFYYSDYNPDGHKTYYKNDGPAGAPGSDGVRIEDRWPCCSGTITQIAADYRISTYLHDERGVYVNLYIPSTVRWQRGGSSIELSQKSTYPLDDRIAFTIRTGRPEAFALNLRIPAWADGAKIAINGKAADVAAKPGSFASIDRTWNNGDRVELQLPLTMRLQAVDPETPKMVALMRGPLVLFLLKNHQSLAEKSLLTAERVSASEWVLKSPMGDVRLRPFTAIGNEQYSTYTQLL